MTAELLEVAAAAVASPVAAACAYLAALAALSGRLPAPRGVDSLRFDVIVPAHDEEANVAATVASLLAMDYPREAFRVVVIADNCSDQTAARARAAGAHVIERFDASRRGKGFALACAFAATLARGKADAVAVVDADTRVSRNLLRAMAARLAAGEVAVQAEYGVLNPDASWRTQLMVLAMSLFHTLRSRARERLGLSCGLRGNGMAIACAALRDVPYAAFSVVEDVEYGVRLAEAGHRVAYAGEAVVHGEMPSSAPAAGTQRRRWERGRRALTRMAPKLLARGIAERSAMLLDVGVDLLVPPLSRLAGLAVVGLAVSAWLGLGAALALCALSAACIAVYVARGAQIAGLGFGAARVLAWAPAYVAWKLTLPSRAPSAWVRTSREKNQ